MRGARWLLLAVTVAIVSAVAFTYRAQKNILREQVPPKPQALASDLNFSAEHYHLRKTGKTGTLVEIDADDFKQVKDSSRVEMRGVVLKLYSKDQKSFDLIKSSAATFFSADDRLFSDGDVEITLAEPADGEAKSNLISIRSSGVNFDTNTGRAETDRPSTFVFRNGDGKATGAWYDPTSHELVMKKEVEVHWKGPGDHTPPMKIEAESLTYHEDKSEIWLKPWGRMTRDQMVVEGYDTILHLADKNHIKQIETNRAHGIDDTANRKLQYAADGLWMDFDDDGQVQKIRGDGNARLVSTSEGAETTITAQHVDMDFDDHDKQSLLTHVNAAGNSLITSKALPVTGRELAENHVLRSDTIEMKMRPGGRELESLVTHAPAQLEFLPNLPAQHHRILEAKDMVIAYGPQNHIDSFHATQVKTVTDPNEEERKRKTATSVTASREMVAHFQPNSSQIASMEQSGEFTYEQGGRRAQAAKATLDWQENVMTLDTGARVWDETGSASAGHIRMDQRSGNFTADGNVHSIRLPEKGQKDSGMLSGDEPLQATARKMASSDRNRKVHYEGAVDLWQGANRVQADMVDVDRENQTLVADGKVVTSLWEEPKDDEKKKAAKPVLTVTRAAHLVYTDQDRLAVYTGGVLLDRPALEVRSRELHAFLAEEGADSRLQKAYADGAVSIVQTAAARTRTGTSEHAEYYPDEQKVILRGGAPKLVDSLHGATTGDELTYFANDDRLRVDGSTAQPAKGQYHK